MDKIVYVTKPTPVDELLNEYKTNKTITKHSKINFHGVNENDVYNISSEFVLNNEVYIAGRVEMRDSELSSVCFFKKHDEENYYLIENVEIKDFQDPCLMYYKGNVVIGGTIIYHKDNKIYSYQGGFYLVKSLDDIVLLGKAPLSMKDVRFIEYKDKILVFTRPQGYANGLGKIGYILLDDIKDLNPDYLEKAEILDCHFINSEWGGCNQLYLLENNLIGVVGHISKKSEGNLHYYPMSFVFNPETGSSSKIKLLLTRADLDNSPAKRSDLKDVLFSGGIIRLNNNLAKLFVGVSDCEGHYAYIKDPFI